MLIQFSRDYRGKLTKEVFYEAGSEVEFDDETATKIIGESAAVAVELPTEDQPVEDAPKPKRGRARKTTED